MLFLYSDSRLDRGRRNLLLTLIHGPIFAQFQNKTKIPINPTTSNIPNQVPLSWNMSIYLSHFFSPEVEFYSNSVLGVVNIHLVLGVVLVFPNQGRLQTRHLVLFSMDKHLPVNTTSLEHNKENYCTGEDDDLSQKSFFF